MLFENYTVVDLSHSLHPNAPTWDNSSGFHFQIGERNDEIKMHTSTGTHIDAPSHFLQEKLTIDSLSFKQLLAPAYVIKVSDRATADYAISPLDIQNHEAAYGPIPENAVVIGCTGWSRYWSDPGKYRNADSNGDMHFPVFSIQAIEYLLDRKIAGIGIDSFAPEPIRSINIVSYPIHNLLFKAGKYIIENLTNLDSLPPKGGYIIALPLKIQKGGEAPARVIGLIPKKR